MRRERVEVQDEECMRKDHVWYVFFEHSKTYAAICRGFLFVSDRARVLFYFVYTCDLMFSNLFS